MRHIVNFGLLFSFTTLVVSAVLAFLLPFSIVTTRVHIVFGLATAILVGLHLASRTAYFRSQLMTRGGATVSKRALLYIAAGWAALLTMAVQGWSPAEALLEQGYEAKNRQQIVRASPLAGFEDLPGQRRLVAREHDENADVAVSLLIRFSEEIKTESAVAVWAETSAGTMIETLYLDPKIAYSETPQWGGKATPRSDILPLWRHRYTMVSGIDPSGEVDGTTGATRSHSFSLDDYLVLGEEKSFVLCVEINAPADANEHYTDRHIGQPSLLYTAYIEIDSPQPYAILELTGHGEGAEKSGAIQYDFTHFSTAQQLIDLALARTTQVSGD